MDDVYAAWVNRTMALQKKFRNYTTRCTECGVFPEISVHPNYFAFNIEVAVAAYCPECAKRAIWEITYDEARNYQSDKRFLKTLGGKWNEQNE